MRRARNILIGLAGGLALSAQVHADDAALTGNPYALVVARNIFGLNPPPPPVDPSTLEDSTPPPKITPNGIMTIFGELQVLFKVAGTGGPGKPNGDHDYILSEGQRQDDIEVVKIDEKGGIVTFNNHGTVQALPLVAAAASSGPAPGGAPAPGAALLPGGGRSFGGRSLGGFGGKFGGGTPVTGGNNPGGMNNSPALGNAPVGIAGNNSSGVISQTPPDLAPETQVIMIEANRMAAQQSGDAESAAILPITELTPPDSGDGANPPPPK